MTKSDFNRNEKILYKAEVIYRTVISQQPFYLSSDCNEHHRQLLETMVGAAIWYLPQGKDLWTGNISINALKELSESNDPQKVTLTKDHQYPRKIAAAELFKLDWSKFIKPHEEVLIRYRNIYGQFNYVLPWENKELMQYQKGHNFVSPEESYRQAGIELRKLDDSQLNLIRKGDRQLVELAILNQLES